jgi:hypothetical protein
VRDAEAGDGHRGAVRDVGNGLLGGCNDLVHGVLTSRDWRGGARACCPPRHPGMIALVGRERPLPWQGADPQGRRADAAREDPYTPRAGHAGSL